MWGRRERRGHAVKAAEAKVEVLFWGRRGVHARAAVGGRAWGLRSRRGNVGRGGPTGFEGRPHRCPGGAGRAAGGGGGGAGGRPGRRRASSACAHEGGRRAGLPATAARAGAADWSGTYGARYSRQGAHCGTWGERGAGGAARARACPLPVRRASIEGGNTQGVGSARARGGGPRATSVGIHKWRRRARARSGERAAGARGHGAGAALTPSWERACRRWRPRARAAPARAQARARARARASGGAGTRAAGSSS
jgi:hypothetical protein